MQTRLGQVCLQVVLLPLARAGVATLFLNTVPTSGNVSRSPKIKKWEIFPNILFANFCPQLGVPVACVLYPFCLYGRRTAEQIIYSSGDSKIGLITPTFT